MKKEKRGITPVVSTVLLIMIVVVMAIIILVWFSSFVGEAITKDILGTKKSVEQYCSEIQLTPELSPDGLILSVLNSGNVPVYEFELKLTKGGDSQTLHIPFNNGGAINPGLTSIINAEDYDLTSYSDYDKIKLIPILLGLGSKTSKQSPYTCPERNGVDVK